MVHTYTQIVKLIVKSHKIAPTTEHKFQGFPYQKQIWMQKTKLWLKKKEKINQAHYFIKKK